MISKIKILLGRSKIKIVIENISWLLFDKFFRAGFGFLLTLWIARYLGPEQFGILNYATAFIGLFSVFVTLGLHSIVVRDILNYPNHINETLGTAAALIAVSGIFSFLVVNMSFWEAVSNDIVSRTVIAILSIVLLFEWLKIINCWFEAQVKSKYIVWSQNGVALFFLILKFYFIINERSLVLLVWAVVVEAAVASGISLFVMDKFGFPLKKMRFSFVRAKSLLSQSWPLMLSGVAIIFYMKIDNIMLSYLLGNEEVGIYAAAVSISEIIYFIPVIVVSSVFPLLLAAKKYSNNLYIERMQFLYDLMTWTSLTFAILLSLFSDQIITIFFGADFQQASQLLSIHVWAGLFVFLGVASSQWLVAESLQVLSMQRTIAGAISNIILNFLMIEEYGVNGAAIATLISYAIAGLFFDLFQRKTRQMFFMKINSFNAIGVALRLYNNSIISRNKH